MATVNINLLSKTTNPDGTVSVRFEATDNPGITYIATSKDDAASIQNAVAAVCAKRKAAGLDYPGRPSDKQIISVTV